MNRRGFFSFLGGAVAAPAVIRIAALMPLRGIAMPTVYRGLGLLQQTDLIAFRREIYRDYIRANLFQPYFGAELTAITRVMNGGL